MLSTDLTEGVPVADHAAAHPSKQLHGVVVLEFTSTNWNAAQRVYIAGVDDLVQDGDVDYQVIVRPSSPSDPVYMGLQTTLTYTNTDDDKVGYAVQMVKGVTTEAPRIVMMSSGA